MKKLLALFAVLSMFIAVPAMAQTWTTANQITVAWDAATVPSGTVSYKLYSKPESGGTETLMTTTTELRATLTFAVEGRYFLGIRTVRTINGIELESLNIGWSNDPAYVTNTFGAQYYELPLNPNNFRIQ